jgi:HSP20 family protein
MSLFNSPVSSSNPTADSCNGGATSCQSQGVKPRYETKETAEAFNLTVYLPGVAKDGLEITAENDQLRISGRRTWKQPEGLTPLYRESFDAPYELVLEHDNAVDLEKIQAELTDGVLQVTLSKAEAAKPRKIAVS